MRKLWHMSDFMGMVARARARTGDKDWAEATDLWARVTAANPVNGDYWARLGEARFGAQDYAGAREAYEKALRLGVRETFLAQDDVPPLMPGEVAYRIACCEAAAGDREAAVAALRVALERGMRDLARVRSDEHWRDLRADQRIRDMAGIIDADSMSRDDGWRYDLAFLAREIKRLAYAPFAIQPEAEFDRAVAELASAIPGLTDAQILVGMMKLVRHLDDGHASVTWPKDDKELSRLLPVDMFWFTEGLYVIGAGPGCEHLLGARVEKIGGLTIDEAMAALDPVMTRDNEHWLTLMFPVLVRCTAILEGLGIDHALTVRLADGTMDEARLEPAPIEFHLDRYPPGWVALADAVTTDGTVAVPRPLHLRNRELPFWFEYLPADNLVYFQFNAVRDHPAETFAAFCDRLFGFIGDQNVGRLVIDMRWNGGGNTLLTQHLLHHLIASKRLTRRGALFIIIGRLTFSAAQNTVTAIERETSAIFVGEPTGSRPNFIGERIDFELPYSRVRANAADLFWQTSWPTDFRTWIAPDIYTPPTFEAYLRSQDPAMDAILAIREHVPG
jgi:tetratricopeptide (TPR) repeat protein